MPIGKPLRTPLAALVLATGMGLGASASADTGPDALKSLSIGGEKVPVVGVEPSPIQGVYRVRLDGGEAFYADASGRYVLNGSLYENTPQGLTNLTRQQEARERKALVQSISAADSVTFKPAGKVKHVVRIFTDSSCPYCQKMHAEVTELNRQGIEVRYQMFPRSGPESAAALALAQVLCSKPSPTEALSAVMRGEALHSDGKACMNKVADQYALGLKLGIKGTPAIFLEDGEMLGGYLPAAQLLQVLEQH